MSAARTLSRMPVRPLAAAALAALALTLGACGSQADAPTAPARPAGGLSTEAGQLLGGGPTAFEAQLRKLRGTPVVVNQWASWCGPCRFEFPFFRALADRYRGRVAFLGVNSNDNREAAERFLHDHPVPYPSYFDPDVKVARVFKGGLAWPTTAYYDRAGKLVETHAGSYASQDKLEQAIRENLL
jgi:cytochrome c biogenesis protein CcmG, thiol:disulfide interchange protein DsbE